MEKFLLERLQEMLQQEFDYCCEYDFDYMKLAIVCKNFMYEAIELEHIDYEHIFTLANWVHLCWNAEFGELSNEEQGYIQAYASRILNENINEIETILRSVV